MTRALRYVGAALLLACGGTEAPEPPVTDPAASTPVPAVAIDYPSTDGSVRWQSWSTATFARARRLERPLLLYVATAGADGLLAADDALVQSLAEERFIPIRVDPWLHPELDRRYGGQWPSLAVVTAQGRLIARAPDIAPERVRVFLLRILAHLQDRPEVVAARTQPTPRAYGPLDPDQVLDAAASDYDAVYGGFGRVAKHHETGLLRFLQMHGGERAEQMRRRSVDAILASDLWNMETGPLLFAQTPSWRMPRREVDSAIVAGWLRVLLTPGSASERHARQELLRFVEGRLWNERSKSFAGRRLPLNEGEWWTDPTIYTDRLADLTWALYETGEIVTERLRQQRREASATLASMVDAEGQVIHARRDSTPLGTAGLLRDQMLVSLALSQAGQLEANDAWRGTAQRAFDWARKHLYDEERRVFHDTRRPEGFEHWPLRMPFADDLLPGGNTLAALYWMQVGEHQLARELMLSVEEHQPLRSLGSAAAIQLQLENDG